jgi:hypothetical protein
MGTNGKGGNGEVYARNDPAISPQDMDSGFVLDEKLNSAAMPFLYLLSSILIAVGAYFIYTLLNG